MAVPIRIVLYAPDNATASSAADAAFSKFHELNTILSDYDPESELRKLCRTSSEGNPIAVSQDLWKVLVRAQSLSEQSGGAFDVTVGSLVLVWRNARRTKELPSQHSIETARASVGHSYLKLHPDQQSVELLKPNMRLDLGGIAKGYAVDEALKVLRNHGITRMMVEAGGNIGLGDPPPDTSGWHIGISRPDQQSPPREYLDLANTAISTSGDMWQYAIIDGKRYSHLIDPRTGMALSEHCSVTVIGPSGLNTDGVSSAIAILGPDQGLKLLEQSPGCSALMIRAMDGKEKITSSKNWPGKTK